MLDAWLDLFLGSRCSGCGVPGRALCPECDRALPTRAALCWPSPPPLGLVPPWSAGEYDGRVRSIVIDHKEHGRLSLCAPLGRLLALAATAAWGAERGTTEPQRMLLVPVPSHPAVVRRRGHDPLLRVAHRAAGVLRGQGGEVGVLSALSVVARPADQAGLGARDRAANVAGRFRLRPSLVEALERVRVPLLLVDDVVTTGATLREAQRALELGGRPPYAAATVAATRLRTTGVTIPLPIRPRAG